MSKIPEARAALEALMGEMRASELHAAFPEIVTAWHNKIDEALAKMTRQIVNKSLERERVTITTEHRAAIMRYRDTGHSCAEVARRVLGRAEASGRVSEIWTEGK